MLDQLAFLFLQIVLHLLQYRASTLCGGVNRHAHFHHHQALVLVGQEGLGNLAEQVAGAGSNQHEGQ
ncbi:hypothetical protein D3C77_728010 [compost metagenome]